MYSEELIKKVFDYDERMSWLESKGGVNRLKEIFWDLNIHYLADKDKENQDTRKKEIITKIENLVEEIAKLMSDVESSQGDSNRCTRADFFLKKDEFIKRHIEIISAMKPGYGEEYYLKSAEDSYNHLPYWRDHRYHDDARAIIYTVLGLSVVDLDGLLEDETMLGDEGIDKQLIEITKDIRALLTVEEWKIFFEFIDQISTKESSRWFKSTEQGFAVRGRLERELMAIEVGSKIEEERKKRIEVEKQLEELKQKIKQQPEQEDSK